MTATAPPANGHQTLTRVLPDSQPDPYRVHELPTDCVEFCPTNPPGRVEDVDDLVESLRTIPQQVPGIVYVHPTVPGKYIAADGNRRLMACRILGITFLVMILDHEPTKGELRRIRLAVNNFHKHMTPDQVADEIRAHIAESGDSQQAAAEFFGLSPSYVSVLLAPFKRLIPELGHLATNPGVTREVLRLVSSMATPELQKKLADLVLADIAREGKAKRDAVAGYAQEMKSGKKSKDKPLVLKQDGIALNAKKPAAEGLRAFAEKLLAAIKKLKPGDPVADLNFHFRTA
jgi:ParB/RepB/Spo0J family partition protein